LPSLDLHTMGPLLKASVTAVTSETAGFPIENAFDYNPDTAWRATSTAQQTIDIDLGQVKQVDAIAIWVRNYLGVTFQVGNKYVLESDDNDDGAYSSTTLQTTVFPDLTSDFPLQIGEDSTPVSKRFWRIIYTYGGSGDIPDIGGFFLTQKQTITKSSNLPKNDSKMFFNRIASAGGGREFIRGVNSNSIDIDPKMYLIEQTDFTALQDAFIDSKGRRFPMIVIQDGEDDRLMRFGSDNLSQQMISEQIYRPAFTLKQLPFIPDGEVF